MLLYDLSDIGSDIKKYAEIIELLHTDTDISKDKKFQQLFNGFYKINQLNKQWYTNFYNYFESVKNSEPSFEQAVRDLYNLNNQSRVDASFCSKLIATINPDKPIIDQYIMWQMGYNTKFADGLKGEEKICYYINAYAEIENQYMAHIHDKAVIVAITDFDSKYPDYQWLSVIKKLDFILWSYRAPRTFSVFEYNKLKEG